MSTLTHERLLALLALAGLFATLAACYLIGEARIRRGSDRWHRQLTYWHRRRMGGVFDHEYEEDWR